MNCHSPKILLIFFTAILITSFPRKLYTDSDSTSDYSESDLRLKTEWFALQLGFGSYLGSIHTDFITLRRPSLFWEIFHMRMTAFLYVGHIEMGTLGGFAFRLGRHFELRTGLGLVQSLYMDDKQHWSGYGISPQICLLATKSRRIKWETTIAVHFPLSGNQGTDKGYEHLLDEPIETPVIFTACFGFRI